MSRRKHQSAPTAPQQPIPSSRSSAPTTAPTPANAPVPDRYRDSLPVCHRHAAGIDVGSRSHWVAAPGADGAIDVAEFDTYTDGLQAIVAWLRARGVTAVALEATGIYGDPLFDPGRTHQK
jgi:hypothetical protein